MTETQIWLLQTCLAPFYYREVLTADLRGLMQYLLTVFLNKNRWVQDTVLQSVLHHIILGLYSPVKTHDEYDPYSRPPHSGEKFKT